MYVLPVSFKLPCWGECAWLRVSLLLCAQYSTITLNHYSEPLLGGGGDPRGDPPPYSQPCCCLLDSVDLRHVVYGGSTMRNVHAVRVLG